MLHDCDSCHAFVTLCDICDHYAFLSKSIIKNRKENQKKREK